MISSRLIILRLFMGLFGFKKPFSGPYKDASTNLIYNLLFCDDLNLFKNNSKQPFAYPFDVLYSEKSSAMELQKIVGDAHSDIRVKVLAYNRLRAGGHKPVKKELLAVIVEIGLEGGLDVLASFEAFR